MGAVEKSYNDATGGNGVNALNPVNGVKAVQNDPWRAYRGVVTLGTSEAAPKSWSDMANNMTGGMFGGSEAGAPGFYQDPGAKPEMGAYQTYLDPLTGKLDPRAQVSPMNAAFTYGDQDAYNSLKSRAMSTGPSAWANMQTQALAGQQRNALNNAASQSAGNTAMANANLASHGGLTGGAAERIARGGMRDMNANRQDIANQGIQAQNQIGISDDAQKTAALGTVGNMSQQYANSYNANNLANTNIQNQGQAQNVQNLLGQASAQNQFNMDKYKTQMGAWGAANTANAIGGAPVAGGGGKGGKK